MNTIQSARNDPPSRLWYALAALTVLAGFAGMAAFMVPKLSAMGDDLIQIVVPGQADLSLEKPGSYTVFHEKQSVVDGTVYASNTISGLKVTVSNAETGTDVPLTASSANMSYSFASRSGTSVFEFEIATPGRYRLTAAYEGGRAEPKLVLAVGQGFVGGLLKTIFTAIGIAFTGVIAAAITVIVVWRKRKKVAQTSSV